MGGSTTTTRARKRHATRDTQCEQQVCRSLQHDCGTMVLNTETGGHESAPATISLNKSGDTGGPLRNRSDFNQALSTLNCLHRESGGQQLRPMPYWKYQQRQPSSSSSSTWWQWSGSWWSSQEFKESQWKRMHAKVQDRTGHTVVCRSLKKTSDEWLSRFFYFVADRSFTVDGGLL